MTAAATFPLLLTLLVLAVIRHGAEGFVQQLIGWDIYRGDSITVPSDGVYLVTIVVDPDDDTTEIRLMINGNPEDEFTAYGIDDVMAGLTVGMVLHAGDVIGGQVSGDLARSNACRLGVARVTSDTAAVRTLWLHQRDRSSILNWNSLLDENRGWTYLGQHSNLVIQEPGMYWLAVRPDSDYSGGLTVRVFKIGQHTEQRDHLFTVYCYTGNSAISASGAFYLTINDTIIVERDSVHKRLGHATLLSLVKLTDNNRTTFQPRIYDHVAYTAYVNPGRYVYGLTRLCFDYNIQTDEGVMFNWWEKAWDIPHEGVYIVSLRGDPLGRTSLLIWLKKNGRPILGGFSEYGVPSGQAGVFHFRRGDRLTIERATNVGQDIAGGTMMSIAFIARE